MVFILFHYYLFLDVYYLFYLFEEVNIKDFLSEQIYNPAAAFSLPRKSQASVGYHLAGQLPGTSSKILNRSNVTNPSQLTISRSTTKNFFNSVVYKFEERVDEEGKFDRIVSTINTESLDRIPIGQKPLIIEAKGLREILSGENLATTATSRRLKKYKFGAENIRQIRVNLKTGFNLEVGDTVILDMAALQISDIDTGTRTESEPRIWEIVNKTFDFRKGSVLLDIIDSNFDRDVRFGLIGPCSRIKVGISTTQFVIEETGNSIFGANEFRKWEDFVANALRAGTGLRIHSEDNSVTGNTTLTALSGNTITVSPALAFTPAAGYFMDMGLYDTAIDEVKLLYGHMSDAVFSDGKPQYVML